MDHLLQGELGLDAPPARLTEAVGQLAIPQQAQHGIGEGRARPWAGRGGPSRPSTTTSGFPPTRVATTGRPAAIASRRLFDIPSQTEERTNTSKWGRSLAAWGTAPRKRTPPFSPELPRPRLEGRAQRAVTDHHELRRRARLA